MPFHPGAIRHYREIGIKIPNELAAMNRSGSSRDHIFAASAHDRSQRT
jgi:hypothetical protein